MHAEESAVERLSRRRGLIKEHRDLVRGQRPGAQVHFRDGFRRSSHGLPYRIGRRRILGLPKPPLCFEIEEVRAVREHRGGQVVAACQQQYCLEKNATQMERMQLRRQRYCGGLRRMLVVSLSEWHHFSGQPP